MGGGGRGGWIGVYAWICNDEQFYFDPFILLTNFGIYEVNWSSKIATEYTVRARDDSVCNMLIWNTYHNTRITVWLAD